MSNIVTKPATTKSGLYDKGYYHSDGGIAVIVDDSHKIEVEKDEYHICRAAIESDKIYEFKNKTNEEILNKLFREEGCEFEMGKAESGDAIICKLVVWDEKRRDVKGKPRDILNKLQLEKSCNLIDKSGKRYEMAQCGCQLENGGAVGGKSFVTQVVFSKKVNPSVRIIVHKNRHNGKIEEIENPRGLRFPFSVGQIMQRNVETWACVNGFLMDGKDVCGDKKIFGVRPEDVPPGHEWRTIFPNKFDNTKFDKNNPDIRYLQGGLIAPNGKPSSLTPELHKLVRTPEFKAWFGDWENSPETASKMLDENGEPAICYHGTNQEFTEFRNDVGHWHDRGFYGDGFYFTFGGPWSRNEAKYYGDKVIPCFIKAINPFDFTDLSLYKGVKIGFVEIESVVFLANIATGYPKLADSILIKKKVWNPTTQENDFFDVPISVLPPLIEKYQKELKTFTTNDIDHANLVIKSGYVKSEIVTYKVGDEERSYERTEDLGRYRTDNMNDAEIEIGLICDAIEKYDGISPDYYPEGYMTRHPEITEAIRETHDAIMQTKEGDEVVVFEPTQIKLADGSNTTFDGSSADIRYSGGGPIPDRYKEMGSGGKVGADAIDDDAIEEMQMLLEITEGEEEKRQIQQYIDELQNKQDELIEKEVFTEIAPTEVLSLAAQTTIAREQEPEPKLTLLSFGGGQDSTAILYSLIYDKDFRKKYAPNDLVVAMSDTGNEFPYTYKAIEDIKELCKKNNIPFYFITPEMGFHTEGWQNLKANLRRNRVILGSAMKSKACTISLKINVVDKFLHNYMCNLYGFEEKANKQSWKFYEEKFNTKARVIIGFAKDEEARVIRSNKMHKFLPKWKQRHIQFAYPMIEEGWNRKSAQDIILKYTKVLPPPSNCMICFYQSEQELLWLWRNYPDEFNDWVQLEKTKLERYEGTVDKNYGVYGTITLEQKLEKAKKNFGHMSDAQLWEYKMSHGHCVKSVY